MEYELPKVSQEINNKVDRWYSKNPRYSTLLFLHYMNQNPLLMRPLGAVPLEAHPFTKQAVLTTLRKLEKQARAEGEKLPIVKEEIFHSFQGGSRTGEQDAPLESALKYVKGNEPLFKSVVELSHQLQNTDLRLHIQYPVLYTLIFIKNQGDANELNELFAE